MKSASLIAGALAFGGGLVKFMDIHSGARESSVSAFLLMAIGFLLLFAGYIGRQKQNPA